MDSQEKDILSRAKQFVERLFEFGRHPDRITTAWLIEKHPELDADEAEAYRQFCLSYTIQLMSCYGDGSIMWPKWKAFRAEVASL